MSAENDSQYHVIVVRGVAKYSLALKLRAALEPYDPDEIVSINVGLTGGFSPSAGTGPSWS